MTTEARYPRAIFRSGLAVLSLFLLPFAAGQEGIIKGFVGDSAGHSLKDAKIILLDVNSGHRYSFKSGRDGKIFKAGIPPADYRLSVELEGYKPYQQTVTISFGEQHILNVTLEKIPPKLDDDKDFQDGVNFFKQGRYKEAFEYFAKVAVRFPESAEVHYNLGLSELMGGKSDEAIVELEKAVELNPDLTEAHFALGECYFGKGENDKAFRAFSRTLEIKGPNAKSYYNLGIVYYKLDKIDEAVSSFEKAIELEPAFSSALYQAGVAHIKKGDLTKALQYLEQFLKQDPNAPEAPQVKAMIEELKRRTGA